jgi:predicted ester cyclase
MSTSTEQNKAIIRRFFDAWNGRQPEAFDELVALDVVRHCQATPGVDVLDLDQLKAFLRLDTGVFHDSVQTIKHLVADGNLVALWATYEGTQRGPMGPFSPSDARAQFDFGAVFRMEDGKIAEWWVTWDNMTILRQLGHLPSA